MNDRRTRGLMIAAPRSGSGKTLLTLGLMRGLRRQGLHVAGAKNGPDYIDPAFHAAATGQPSVNLDTWAMAPQDLLYLAARAAGDADLLIAEGSMGLFDGVPAAAGRTGASADLAALLGLPVILLVDVSGQAQSAAAIVKGCMAYDPRVKIAGVILNRISSERHLRLIQGAVEALGAPVLGALPRAEALALPERHLGLVQAGETADLEARLERIADFVTAHVDMPALTEAALPLSLLGLSQGLGALPPPGQRIAIARDAAFSFLYPHLLAGWRAAGADILWFSPLADEAPAAGADICWLPGGYPELHAGPIAGAGRFLAGLRAFAERKPVHGECGGYMVLGAGLEDASGVTHAMAGLLGVVTSFAKRRMNLGYRAARLLSDGPLGPAATRLRGHEFHYASVVHLGADEPFAIVEDAYGSAPSPAGGRRGKVTGSFFHAIARG